MIAPNSMSGGPTFQPDRRQFQRISRRRAGGILASLILATLAATLLNPLTGGWRQIAAVLFYCLVYSSCIGSLAWLILPRVGMYSARLKPIRKWTLAVSSMIAVAVVGTFVARVLLSSLG